MRALRHRQRRRRLDAGIDRLELTTVAALMHEVEIRASLQAKEHLGERPVDQRLQAEEASVEDLPPATSLPRRREARGAA